MSILLTHSRAHQTGALIFICSSLQLPTAPPALLRSEPLANKTKSKTTQRAEQVCLILRSFDRSRASCSCLSLMVCSALLIEVGSHVHALSYGGNPYFSCVVE